VRLNTFGWRRVEARSERRIEMLLVLALIGYGFIFVGGTFMLLAAFRLYQRMQHPPSRAHVGLISMSLLLLLSCIGVVVLTLTPFALNEAKRVSLLLVLSYVTLTLINLINDWASFRENYRKFPRVRAGILFTALGTACVGIAVMIFLH
jgi:hypothetical protein